MAQQMELLAFDNKISPKDPCIQLQVAITKGARYIVQGNSSGVANALTEAIDRATNASATPDSRVLFLNYARCGPCADPMTKCNFWHSRSTLSIFPTSKMDALTDVNRSGTTASERSTSSGQGLFPLEAGVCGRQ